jgi:hypothetical protein
LDLVVACEEVLNGNLEWHDDALAEMLFAFFCDELI